MKFTDSTLDRNASEVYTISQRLELPEYVKEASFDELQEKATHRSVFADPVNKLFPCDSPARTWLNYAYFQNQKEAMTPLYVETLEGNFAKLSAYWEVSLEDVRTAYPDSTKEAQAGMMDGCDDDDDQEGTGAYPLRNAAEVKMAGQWFADNAFGMPLVQRTNLARELYEKGPDLPQYDFIRKQAGYGFSTHQDMVSGLMQRLDVVKTAEDQSALLEFCTKVAAAVAIPSNRPDDFVKYAEAIEDFDEQIGFKSLYGTEGRLSPMEVICREDFHKYAEIASKRCTLVTGTQYDSQEFDKIARDDLKAVFGDDFVDGISDGLGHVDSEKLAEVVQTMPRPDAELFDELVDGRIHKYASAKVEQTDWAKYARAYAAK